MKVWKEEEVVKPNIILIMADQLNYDGVGVHNPHISTPTLDQFAKEGFDFHQAYSATPTCIPARATLMSGLKATSTGIVGYDETADWNFPYTLASIFQERGYYTKAIGKLHVNPSRKMMNFHHIELHDGYLHATRQGDLSHKKSYQATDDYYTWLNHQGFDLTDSGLDPNSWVARPFPYHERYHPTNWATERAIDFLRVRDKEMPFFLMLSYVRPHSPLDPPEFYFNKYMQSLPRDLRPISGDWNHSSQKEPVRTIDSLFGQLSSEDYRSMLAGYYGNITHMDHQIQRFLIHLQEAGELKRSIIVFVSDHGDQLGHHGLFRKGFPYQHSIHIPLFIYDPGNLLGSDRSKVSDIDMLVDLSDILPTLLDLATEEILEEVDGRSVKPYLYNDRAEPIRQYLHGEHVLGEWSHQFILKLPFKYIWYTQTGEEQLFDLARDPEETHNLINEPNLQEMIGELRMILVEELKERPEGFVLEDTLIAGQAQKPLIYPQDNS